MKLMSLVILGNACQAFTSFSPLFTRVEEIVRAGKAEPEQNDGEEQKERQQKEHKDTTGFERRIPN